MHVYQGARKPSHGTLKSAPQAMVKGHSKTPGPEGKDLEKKESQMLNDFFLAAVF